MAKNHASMDYYDKEVTFRQPVLPEVMFHGEVGRLLLGLIISTLTTKKLLKKGHQRYPAHMVDTQAGGVRFEAVAIVTDFLDVFLDELLWLSLEKDTDFSIELVLSTAPISSLPYHMALAELRELKVQLQDLVDKGFIRASVST